MIVPKDIRKCTAPQKRQSPTPPRTVSDKQIAANRRNARHSTGPRTAEGKKRSRKNALKHGLFARHLPLDERPFLVDPAAYEEQITQLVEDFNPQTQIEMNIIENLVMEFMRLSYIHAKELCLLMDGGPPQRELDRLYNQVKTLYGRRGFDQLHQDRVDIKSALEKLAQGQKPTLPEELADVLAVDITNDFTYMAQTLSAQRGALEKRETNPPDAAAPEPEQRQWQEEIGRLRQSLAYHTQKQDEYGPDALGCHDTRKIADRLRGETRIPKKYHAAWREVLQRKLNQVDHAIKDIEHFQKERDALHRQYAGKLLDPVLEQEILLRYEVEVQRNIDKHLKRLKMLKHDILD